MFCIKNLYYMKYNDGEHKKHTFFCQIGIFCLELEKKQLFGIGNGAKF